MVPVSSCASAGRAAASIRASVRKETRRTVRIICASDARLCITGTSAQQTATVAAAEQGRSSDRSRTKLGPVFGPALSDKTEIGPVGEHRLKAVLDRAGGTLG